jgi:hypothetical protein
MPPKAKKKTPKQQIKELEVALAAATAGAAATEHDLRSTAERLAGTIDGLKALVLTQQRERDASHDAAERELRMELGAAGARITQLRETAAHAREDAAAVALLERERVALLRETSEAVASCEALERRHAAETHELNNQIASLKT